MGSLLVQAAPWKRSLAVYTRVPPTGAPEAFVALLRATWAAPGVSAADEAPVSSAAPDG
ncbi:hypothetical protein ACGFX8_22715 [Streptomyces sp. NPDC048362]|uniref:hypothetical protein n=1 Tax=Streptomyces sp. NPDC048362 TaxID=3365539 RepID=UPI0037210FBB